MMVRAVWLRAIAGVGFAWPVSAVVAVAQTEVVAPPAPDADALAAAMRSLAVMPDDLDMLLRAGTLTLKLGDPTAASAFFDRAARIDPNNARARAGTASVLVQLERPGEALRRFGEAEALGLDARNFAADRALAYDLTGDQRRAQRDYRIALAAQPDDQETQRRYALSLGISGDRARALGVIDALLRRGDRAAWRVRSFVLALTGDPAGAGAVADQMLPATMAQGLHAFFERLPRLSAVDQAWAVHFGELAPTEARLADARLAPALPPLPAEPGPTTLAVAPPPQPAPSAHQRRKVNRQQAATPVAVARVVPPPVVAPDPLPTPPRVMSPETPAASPTLAAVPRQIAPIPVATAVTKPLTPEAQGPPKPVAVVPPPVVVAAKPPGAPTPPASEPAKPPAVEPAKPPAVEPAKPSANPPVADPPKPIAPVAPPKPEPITVPAPVVAPAALPTPPSAPPGAAPPPVAKPVGREQSILARIMDTVGVPARELRLAPTGEAAAPSPAPDAAAEARKRAADAKKAEEKRKAEAKKAADAKAAAEKARAAEAEAKRQRAAEKAAPARVWVQVAGGATQADLPKAWVAVRGKAPAAFRGKAGYATPLRFTNRVLTGPFASRAEAQAFVNDIAKSGISGFVFTSAAGQKIEPLRP